MSRGCESRSGRGGSRSTPRWDRGAGHQARPAESANNQCARGHRLQGGGAGHPQAILSACAATAARAAELGLTVNIGHDLNCDNLPPLVAALPVFAEASIGHELTADALVIGFAAAVRAYKAALEGRPAPMIGR